MNLRERIFGRKVWKVTRDGWSVVASGSAGVQYRPLRKARAPGWLAREGCHLTAFENYGAAESFAALNPGWLNSGAVAVYEARAWGPVHLPVMGDWMHIGRGELVHSYGYWPTGTVMFREIMPVRRVAVYEF